eukprot:g10712.t2
MAPALLRLGAEEFFVDLPETPAGAAPSAEPAAERAAPRAPVVSRSFVPRQEDERPLPPLTGTARAKELNRALRRLVCGGAGQINELDRCGAAARAERYEDRAEKRRRLHPVEWEPPAPGPTSAAPNREAEALPLPVPVQVRRFTEARGPPASYEEAEAPKKPCLIVKQVIQGGVVAAWNLQCKGSAFAIQSGDYIVRVNDVTDGITAFMEDISELCDSLRSLGPTGLLPLQEMRARSELHLTVLRRTDAPDANRIQNLAAGRSALGAPGASQMMGHLPRPPPFKGAGRALSGYEAMDLRQPWREEARVESTQSTPLSEDFTFEVEIEKPRGHKMGIDVMLMTGGGRCGLLVGQVAVGIALSVDDNAREVYLEIAEYLAEHYHGQRPSNVCVFVDGYISCDESPPPKRAKKTEASQGELEDSQAGSAMDQDGGQKDGEMGQMVDEKGEMEKGEMEKGEMEKGEMEKGEMEKGEMEKPVGEMAMGEPKMEMMAQEFDVDICRVRFTVQRCPTPIRPVNRPQAPQAQVQERKEASVVLNGHGTVPKSIAVFCA